VPEEVLYEVSWVADSHGMSMRHVTRHGGHRDVW
jgi:hypothetical protein